uniref:BTB domain-containing protein n=1 Tax=Bracon brevicornis TaxID=1563983 RepID=A0A6V7I2Q8_9HYME
MARSPVFAEMFQRKDIPHQHEPRELPLCGVQFEAFRELLYFIYTDRSPNMNDLLPRLLMLANHYQIQGLKNLCERSVLESLDVDKAAQYLCIADQAKSKELKTKIINYINTNLHEVLETKGFRIMKQKYPDMLVELLRASTERAHI